MFLIVRLGESVKLFYTYNLCYFDLMSIIEEKIKKVKIILFTVNVVRAKKLQIIKSYFFSQRIKKLMILSK